MLLRLLLLFTIIPLAELFLLIWIGTRIGTLATVAIVISTGMLGAWLARQEGLRTLHGIRAEMAEGRMPTEQLLDGLLILVAGAVLLTPGLLTDLCGLLLLIPAGRRLVRRKVSGFLRGRLHVQQPITIEGHWQRED